MRRTRALLVTLAVATLSALLATIGFGAATGTTARVVVTKSGLVRGGEGSDFAEYGLVLANRSATQDALDVTVKVRGLDSRGRAFTSDEVSVTVIPATSSFVVSGSLIWNVSIDLARIATVIRVGKSATKGRRLPPVQHVTVTNDGQDIAATLVNPYARSLPGGATIYGLFLDQTGRIVAVDSHTTDAVLSAGTRVAFTLSGAFSTTAQHDAVASARVSVDPCGYDALTRACPITGMRAP